MIPTNPRGHHGTRIPHASLSRIAMAIAVLACAPAWAQETMVSDAESPTLAETVVTTVSDTSPVTVVTDPKQPRQPVPASDAADYLKTIPGFSAIRSGGSNSDPVFRGMFGSRLPILTNGTTLLGACPARMDSPSSYISPQTFDVLTVVKGPETVLWGPGTSAGVVRFDRETPDFSTQNIHLDASAVFASRGRNDQTVDLSVGNDRVYTRMTANRSHSQDYEDGNGRTVPSKWDKWNTDVTIGVTPDADTLLELTAGTGDGEARYGGRAMDGVKFRRDSAGLRFEKRHISTTLSKIEAQIYYNYADHVMDNYTLRPFSPSSGMSMPMAVNPDRQTIGGRIAATLEFSDTWQLVSGLDYQQNEHSSRSGTDSAPYDTKSRVRDARFDDVGAFGELTWQFAPAYRLISGLRVDRAGAQRYPTSASSSTMSMSSGSSMNMGASSALSATTSKNERQRLLPSGFLRWEHDLPAQHATIYAGLGHSERFPDYWELIAPSNSTAESGDTFNRLKPEKTTQLDIGANWAHGNFKLWTSAYAGRVSDYILFDYSTGSSVVSNVDANIAGAELGASYQLTPSWSAQGTLAYAWGRNATDHSPLPQMPPLEARLGVDYRTGSWTAGALWRLVAAQHSYALGQGNVVGKDFGPSSGFGVLSINSGYDVNRHLKLTVGLDNLLNKTYSEHLNLAGNSGFGYSGTMPINEPGRTLWVRADVKF